MRRDALVGAVCAVVLAGALVVGCGDDGETTGSSSGSASSPAGEAPVSLPGTVSDHGTETLAEGGALAMELDDQYFAPTFVEAPAGGTVALTLTNEGDLPHTFTIDEADVDEEVAAGASTTVEVTLPENGSLRYYCRFHVAGGMQGAFVVSAEGAPATTVVAGGVSGY
jgi:plastocyanin